MSWFQILITALVQGVSEFLPISSSGHLILLPLVADWPDQGLIVDVMVHVGSLCAIFVYFWRDILTLVRGGAALLIGRVTPHGLLAISILAATLPAIAFGLFLERTGLVGTFRGPELIAWNAIIFGGLLYLADAYGPRIRRFSDITLPRAFGIGCAQATALIPGVSRSGITMTLARFLGIERPDAARFSFLLGIPATMGAALLVIRDAIAQGSGVSSDAMWTGFFTFFFALGAIAFLMEILKRYSFAWFAGYRLVLGVVLLVCLFFGIL